MAILVGFALIAFGAARAEEGEATVRQFIQAYNRHDIDSMLQYAHVDIRWMSISAASSQIVTSGHDPLRQAMASYFKAVPSSRSELRSVHASGPFVHTVEQAYWQTDSGRKNQCSMAVYQLEAGKILNVWYFPAHACE